MLRRRLQESHNFFRDKFFSNSKRLSNGEVVVGESCELQRYRLFAQHFEAKQFFESGRLVWNAEPAIFEVRYQ